MPGNASGLLGVLGGHRRFDLYAQQHFAILVERPQVGFQHVFIRLQSPNLRREVLAAIAANARVQAGVLWRERIP